MSKLRPISFKELVKKLKNLGFEGPFPGGKHMFMIRGDLRLSIPNPHRHAIGADLLKRLLRKGGIQRDEWNQA